MSFDVNNPINPREMMPMPNEYFFIYYGDNDTRFLIPAVLDRFCDSADFYKNVILFEKTGESVMLKFKDSKMILGWVKMFEKTETYIIQKQSPLNH